MSHQQQFEQQAHEEMHYHFVIQDFKGLIKAFGAKTVMRDLCFLAPDEYDAIVGTVLATETVYE